MLKNSWISAAISHGFQVQREDEWRGKGRGGGVGGRMSTDKQKKQLAELEAQLVLASPHLLFQVCA